MEMINSAWGDNSVVCFNKIIPRSTNPEKQIEDEELHSNFYLIKTEEEIGKQL